jgi:hypothetical protein
MLEKGPRENFIPVSSFFCDFTAIMKPFSQFREYFSSLRKHNIQTLSSHATNCVLEDMKRSQTGENFDRFKAIATKISNKEVFSKEDVDFLLADLRLASEIYRTKLENFKSDLPFINGVQHLEKKELGDYAFVEWVYGETWDPQHDDEMLLKQFTNFNDSVALENLNCQTHSRANLHLGSLLSAHCQTIATKLRFVKLIQDPKKDEEDDLNGEITPYERLESAFVDCLRLYGTLGLPYPYDFMKNREEFKLERSTKAGPDSSLASSFSPLSDETWWPLRWFSIQEKLEFVDQQGEIQKTIASLPETPFKKRLFALYDKQAKMIEEEERLLIDIGGLGE